MAGKEIPPRRQQSRGENSTLLGIVTMKTAVDSTEARDFLRKAMPVVESCAYFDHAAVAPISGPAADRLRKYATDLEHYGDLIWPDNAAEIESYRQLAADMLNAHVNEIAWIANTTQGINFVAAGLDWREGDNLVTLANEFPSNLYPWLQLADRGVETRRAPVAPAGHWTAEQVLAACDARTRLISVSWVGFASGFRGPLHELVERAHQHGIRVFLDAIQGLGVLPLDVRQLPIDFLAADGHKWMLGPEGAGLLYIATDRLNELSPMNVGWNSVVDRYNFDHIELKLRESASRYEGGTQNVPGVLAFGASLELLAKCGHGPRHSCVAQAIAENVEQLTDGLRQIGAEVLLPGAEFHSGIVPFTLPHADMQGLRDICGEQQVAISYRGGRLRASPHAYTNQDDIQRLLAILKQS